MERALALFVLDPALLGPSGAARTNFQAVHQPWTLRDGIPDGYPERRVEH